MGKDCLRKCISCGELKFRAEMIKITKEHLCGSLVVNPNPLTFGRSAYLCYNQKCIDTAIKKNRLNKVLKTSMQIDKEVLYTLLQDRKGQLDG